MEYVSLVFSLISAAVAIAAVIIAYRALQQQKKSAKWTANFTRLANAESMLRDFSELLGFHGIEHELLNKCNTTPGEVVYLLLSFRAGQEWAHLDPSAGRDLSRYRKRMLGSKKVALIWQKILRGRLIFSSTFTQTIDDYLQRSEHLELSEARRSEATTSGQEDDE